MSVIEKTVRIESIRRSNEKVHLTLTILESNSMSPKVPNPEMVIEHLPKSDTERVTKDLVKSLAYELKKQGIMPTLPTVMRPRVSSVEQFSVLLSRTEYEKIGNPTVFDELKLRLERKTA